MRTTTKDQGDPGSRRGDLSWARYTVLSRRGIHGRNLASFTRRHETEILRILPKDS
jgi:hypothetical protein